MFYDIDTCWYMGVIEQYVWYLLQKLVGTEMWEVEDYKDMQHGWVTRGDLKVTIYNWTWMIYNSRQMIQIGCLDLLLEYIQLNHFNLFWYICIYYHFYQSSKVNLYIIITNLHKGFHTTSTTKELIIIGYRICYKK